MRTAVLARDLKEGSFAFLPYFGKLRKARVLEVGKPRIPASGGEPVLGVVYEIRDAWGLTRCQSTLTASRTYEIYNRTPKKDRS